MPKVSILLPTLNSRQYLEPRLDSILSQTYQDWEIVILDGHSTDGTIEYIEKYSSGDKRFNIYQSRVAGIYPNFNRCIQLANGEYVYFATSDDTMATTCLERMTRALDEHPECDIAHCKLKIIDEKGNDAKNPKWDNFFLVKYFDKLLNQKHIRFAPHDGILYFSGYPVYTSLNQLLIRRKLFNKVGNFLNKYGAVANFEWGMRATLLANTIHLPEYLASWRVHSNQSTSVDFINHAKGRGGFLKMANHAFNFARRQRPSRLNKFNKSELNFILLLEKLHYQMQGQRSILARRLIMGKWFLCHREILNHWMGIEKNDNQFLPRKGLVDHLRKIIRKYGLDKNIEVLEYQADKTGEE